MDHKQFLHACDLINTSLVNQVMDRTFNSVGSSVFFEFGKQEEFVFPNGKRGVQKEWSIWLNWTSWRISQHNKYIVGSGENLEVNIQTYIEKLLGKRFQSFQFLSQFLDIEFDFEDGYRISTFFNRFAEDQWLMFLPDKTELIIDCSSKQAIESVQYLSKQVEIKHKYKELELPILNTEVKDVVFGERALLQIICTEDFSVDLGLSAWRLEKNGQYQEGRIDYYFGSSEGKGQELEDKLSALIGQKIQSVSMDVSGMDLKLDIDGGYVFEIFSHSKAGPWKIFHNNEVVLHARVE